MFHVTNINIQKQKLSKKVLLHNDKSIGTDRSDRHETELCEPPHDKTNKILCSQRRLRSAWASTQSDQSSLSAWRKLRSLATYWAQSKDSDQTGRMPRLIWVFARRRVILLVLSWGGSYMNVRNWAKIKSETHYTPFEKMCFRNFWMKSSNFIN